MPIKNLFDFITDPTVNEENMDLYLDKVCEKMRDNHCPNEVEEEVFKQAFIPQTLTQVNL